jgi:hypothetical protein
MILLALFLCPMLVSCHGSLREPPARNVLADSNFCPDCLNAGGVSVVYGRGHAHPGRYGVCGDPWNAPRDHEAGGRFARGRIARTYTSGQTITLQLGFSANHMGRMMFKLCVLPDGISVSRERALTTQSCFDKHVLVRQDHRAYSFLKKNVDTMLVEYRLPKNVTCRHCVLQWSWDTGNSCCPAHTPRRYCAPGVETCFKDTVPEQWWNCADIRIVN